MGSASPSVNRSPQRVAPRGAALLVDNDHPHEAALAHARSVQARRGLTALLALVGPGTCHAN